MTALDKQWNGRHHVRQVATWAEHDAVIDAAGRASGVTDAPDDTLVTSTPGGVFQVALGRRPRPPPANRDSRYGQ